ncbi:MAG: outer membrane protein assembly factor BamA [Desulfobulbaceae bacterium]|nr:outer membrane protein assembly factor BamA [Desulfobulbaceae bacterium]
MKKVAPAGGTILTLIGLLILLFLLHPLRDAAGAENIAAGAAAGSVGKNGDFRVVFQGNDHLSDSNLRAAVAEELAGFAGSDFPEAKADDAAFMIESTYKKAGYAFVKAAYRIAAEKDGTLLEFTITEGPQVLVSGIIINGNHTFTNKELLSFFEEKSRGLLGTGSLVFVKSEIRDGISAIRDLYTGDGFLQVKIDEPEFVFSPDRSRVEARLAITEGQRITVGAIRFQGDILADAGGELDKLAAELTGKPFLGRRKLMLKSGVQEIYGNRGYPDVQVDIDENRDDSSSEINLTCTIMSGPQVVIAGIEVVGNTRTDREFIVNRLALRQGDTFSSRKERESFQRLYQTGLFSRVGLDLSEGANANERILTVHVEEALGREVFFQGGWGSYELLRGSAGFQDRNIFGSGRVFRAEVGGSIKSANVEAGVRDPRIFGTDISADLPVFFRYREEPSFTREELGMSVLFTKDLRKDLSVSLAYLYSSIKTRDIVAMDIAEPESDYTTAGLKLQTTLDTRNDIFFPTSGRRIFAAAEIAEPSLGSDLSFYRFNFGARQFYPLSKKNTLALRYATGVIFPSRNQITIPIGERFFNGGENTVRSFRESELGPQNASGDPLGGMAFNVFTVELRRLLTDRLAASLFLDYGNVSPNLSPEEDSDGPFTDRQDVIDRTLSDYFTDFRPGLGVGLQYLLPVGPARLDFAWNPDQDRDREEDSFTVHFSIGMAF